FIRSSTHEAQARSASGPGRGQATDPGGIVAKTHNSLSLFSFQRPTGSPFGEAQDSSYSNFRCQPRPVVFRRPGLGRDCPVPREPVSIMSGGKGKTFFRLFSAESPVGSDVPSRTGGPGKI